MKFRWLVAGKEFQEAEAGFFDKGVCHLDSILGSGFGKDPGAADGQAAYHYPVAVRGAAEHFLRGGYVAIADQGDCQFLSECGDIAPAGPSLEFFPGGSGVKGNKLNTLLFKTVAKAYEVVKVIVRAGAQLDAEATACQGPKPPD